MKPIKVKPHFYAHCYAGLQQIAFDSGYNLLLHGSLNRDLDLVAVPWIDKPKTHFELLKAMQFYLYGLDGGAIVNDSYFKYQEGLTEDEILQGYYCYSKLPGGRSAYIINLNRGGRYNGYQDEEYYLDISITPLVI